MREHVISNGRLRAGIMEWGAVVRDLRIDLPGGPRSLVLGFDNLDDYIRHSPHFGAIAGRFANRISEGRFRLDGRDYQVTRNQNGLHHLHGGENGFGKRDWSLVEAGSDSVLLRIVSPDGDEGYPGRLTATCRYSLTGDDALRIELMAETDAPTIVNLAHHSYFNLDGAGDILDSMIEIASDRYTPLDDSLIPTGEIRPIDGTPYDFRRSRKIRHDTGDGPFAYDVNYVLADAPRAQPQFAARVIAAGGDVAMEVLTTEPGLQFYTGAKLDTPVPGLAGMRYGPFAGLCLEPQRFPDSPNHDNFTDATLRPGNTYRQITEYRFTAVA